MKTEQNDQNKLSLAKPEFETPITKKELARRLSVSIGTIDKMIKNKTIPYMKLGYVIRFMWSDVSKTLFQEANNGN